MVLNIIFFIFLHPLIIFYNVLKHGIISPTEFINDLLATSIVHIIIVNPKNIVPIWEGFKSGFNILL